MENLLYRSKLFIKRNAPTILTCAGGVGVVATTVMAVKATPKALGILERAKEEKGDDLTKLEIIQVAGPVYIPTVLVGAGTLTCIFGANILNTRHQASLTSAYMLLDGSYKDYKKKAAELYGEDADGQIKEEIAKDKYEETDISVGEDEKLFFDSFSGQYFKSNNYKVQNAEYQLNRDLSMRSYATLNDFYEYLGIDPHPAGDELGWSSGMNFDYYWQEWVDFNHRHVTLDDGQECCIVSMYSEPTIGWEDY